MSNQGAPSDTQKRLDAAHVQGLKLPRGSAPDVVPRERTQMRIRVGVVAIRGAGEAMRLITCHPSFGLIHGVARRAPAAAWRIALPACRRDLLIR